MISIIMLFLVLGAIAYLLKNPKVIAMLLIGFMGIISIFTPFWPFLLLGLFALVTVKKEKQ